MSERTRAIVDVLAEHRSPKDRTERGTPLCFCGHDLGWGQTWPEHVAGLLEAALADMDLP